MLGMAHAITSNTLGLASDFGTFRIDDELPRSALHLRNERITMMEALRNIFDSKSVGGKCLFHVLVDIILSKPQTLMISFLDFSPLDVANFFEDILTLKRGHQQVFYVCWYQFRNILITETMLSSKTLRRISKEYERSSYERMAYHEYLMKRGVITEKIINAPKVSSSFQTLRSEGSTGSKLIHEDNHHSMVTKFRGESHKKLWMDDPFSDDEDMNLTIEAQKSKVSLMLIACRSTQLTDEEYSKIRDVFSFSADDTVLIEKFNTPITRRLLKCLDGCSWLNDEVVNFSMSMLQERDTKMCENFKERISSHYYNSFFMNKLMDSGDGTYNYNNVKRWSKKFNIFRKLKVFCPINLKNTHWTMLVMYLQEKRIEYYDSMGSRGTRYLNGALQYLQDESIKVNESSFNPDEWELTSTTHHVPQQENGFDCGVFSIMYADFITDNLPLSFSQEDMPFYRKKICANILRGSLNYPLTC